MTYSEKDIHRELLTPEEQTRFQGRESQKDMRDILLLTRSRFETTDMDGNPILSPKEWLEAFEQWFQNPHHKPDGMTETIFRTIKHPKNGKQIIVEAGLEQVTRSLLERGLPINEKYSHSGMVTDHPGFRWMHEEDNEWFKGLLPGENINSGKDWNKTVLAFDVQSHHREQITELLQQAANKSGWVYRQTENDRIELTLPCTLDGTAAHEIRKEARQNITPEVDEKGRKNWVNMNKQYYAESEKLKEAHGGLVVYSDEMIIRNMQMLVNAIDLAQQKQNKKANSSSITGHQWQGFVNLSAYLTTSERIKLQSEYKMTLSEKYKSQIIPNEHLRYKEDKETVDQIAQMAGFKDLAEVLWTMYRHQGDDNNLVEKLQHWSELATQHLTGSRKGCNTIAAMYDRIIKECMDERNNKAKEIAENRIQQLQQKGLPIHMIKDLYINGVYEANPQYILHPTKGSPMRKKLTDELAKEVQEDSIVPIEAACRLFADELQKREQGAEKTRTFKR